MENGQPESGRFKRSSLQAMALVVTATGAYDFTGLVSVVKSLGYQNHGRFHMLWLGLGSMEKYEEYVLSIPDVDFALRRKESRPRRSFCQGFLPRPRPAVGGRNGARARDGEDIQFV